MISGPGPLKELARRNVKVISAKKYFLLCLILAFIGGCQSEKQTTVPLHLVGLWKTAAPKYSDRFFRLTTDSIVFGVGEGRTDISPIVAIKETQEQGLTLYTISYLNPEGQEYRLAFYTDPVRKGVLWFKNQPGISWSKAKGP
jgi:hypothetical protein